jgi:hypothetical protein
MPERRHRTERNPDKGEAADSAEAAMDRFESLARRLLHVTPDELAEERKKKPKARARNGGGVVSSRDCGFNCILALDGNAALRIGLMCESKT